MDGQEKVWTGRLSAYDAASIEKMQAEARDRAHRQIALNIVVQANAGTGIPIAKLLDDAATVMAWLDPKPADASSH